MTLRPPSRVQLPDFDVRIGLDGVLHAAISLVGGILANAAHDDDEIGLRTVRLLRLLQLLDPSFRRRQADRVVVGADDAEICVGSWPD